PLSLLFSPHVAHRVLHSFPTRRSSDLLCRGLRVLATMKTISSRLVSLLVALALTLAGCATPGRPAEEAAVARPPSASALTVNRALEERILALDPEHLSGDDVRTLAQGPA